MLFLAFGLIFDRSGIFHNLGVTFQAWARFSEESTAAATRVLSAGTNLTVSVAHVAVAAAETTLSLGENIWTGVDVTNIEGERRIGRVASYDRERLQLWLVAGAGDLVPPDLTAKLVSATGELSEDLPSLERSGRVFNYSGHLTLWQFKGRKLRLGYFAISVAITESKFEVMWANIVWDALELSMRRQSARILRAVEEALDELKPIDPVDMELTQAALMIDELPLAPFRQMPGIVRAGYKLWALGSWLHAHGGSLVAIPTSLFLVWLMCCGLDWAFPDSMADEGLGEDGDDVSYSGYGVTETEYMLLSPRSETEVLSLTASSVSHSPGSNSQSSSRSWNVVSRRRSATPDRRTNEQ